MKRRANILVTTAMGKIRASAETTLDWEYVTVRWQDNGGYQLLTAYWHHQLWSVDVAKDDGRRLQRGFIATLCGIL